MGDVVRRRAEVGFLAVFDGGLPPKPAWAEAAAPTHPHAGVESATANVSLGPFLAIVDRESSKSSYDRAYRKLPRFQDRREPSGKHFSIPVLLMC